MKVSHSRDRPAKTQDPAIEAILREVSSENLEALVKLLAFPRHYVSNQRANRKARDLLLKHARAMGYAPVLQGSFDNIVMTSRDATDGPCLLLGAHYNSVPDSPGADDNASAVAVCLECARLIRKHDLGPAMIVLFNREEDGLLGSSEFVAELAEEDVWRIKEAHIFEMVGYRDPNSRVANLAAGPADPHA